MKHIKKTALLLALLMLITTFAGCGKGEVASIESNGAKVTLNGDAIYPVQCDDTLTFWFTGTAIWETKYQNFGETPLGKEVAKKSGVNIEYVHPSAGQGGEPFQRIHPF